MINLHQCTVKFSNNDPVYALIDLSLHVKKGEWLSVLGPSGSGKTTLLNVIAGKQPLSTGSVVVNEADVNTLPEREKQKFRRDTIGFIFQHYRLFNQYSVLENVMLPQWPYQTQQTLRKKATSLLEKVDMSHRLTHLPEQLSGGEKQRVAIARALLNNPSILLCDEPTGNLDAENRQTVVQLIRELNDEGITIIVVTHDEEVAKYGERQLFLRDGIIEDQVVI